MSTVNMKIKPDPYTALPGIKICGLTDPAEAVFLNANHIEYAGMVLFYPESKRNVTPEKAKLIMSALDPVITTVAVTVSPDADSIRSVSEAGFDMIQIHGSLPEPFPPDVHLPIIKAFNVDDLPDLPKYTCNKAIKGFVMDAKRPGSGRTFDWDLIKDLDLKGRLLILAGGLDPVNVKEAVSRVKPDIVDVSSGVEYAGRPGKDPEKIRAFVRAVRNG